MAKTRQEIGNKKKNKQDHKSAKREGEEKRRHSKDHLLVLFPLQPTHSPRPDFISVVNCGAGRVCEAQKQQLFVDEDATLLGGNSSLGILYCYCHLLFPRITKTTTTSTTSTTDSGISASTLATTTTYDYRYYYCDYACYHCYDYYDFDNLLPLFRLLQIISTFPLYLLS